LYFGSVACGSSGSTSLLRHARGNPKAWKWLTALMERRPTPDEYGAVPHSLKGRYGIGVAVEDLIFTKPSQAKGVLMNDAPSTVNGSPRDSGTFTVRFTKRRRVVVSPSIRVRCRRSRTREPRDHRAVAFADHAILGREQIAAGLARRLHRCVALRYGPTGRTNVLLQLQVAVIQTP
jgi:hypothetical protein